MYGISLPADPAGEDALAEWAVFVLRVDVQRVHGGQRPLATLNPCEGGQRGVRGGSKGDRVLFLNKPPTRVGDVAVVVDA